MRQSALARYLIRPKGTYLITTKGGTTNLDLFSGVDINNKRHTASVSSLKNIRINSTYKINYEIEKNILNCIHLKIIFILGDIFMFFRSLPLGSVPICHLSFRCLLNKVSLFILCFNYYSNIAFCLCLCEVKGRQVFTISWVALPPTHATSLQTCHETWKPCNHSEPKAIKTTAISSVEDNSDGKECWNADLRPIQSAFIWLNTILS